MFKTTQEMPPGEPVKPSDGSRTQVRILSPPPDFEIEAAPGGGARSPRQLGLHPFCNPTPRGVPRTAGGRSGRVVIAVPDIPEMDVAGIHARWQAEERATLAAVDRGLGIDHESDAC